MPKLLAIMSPKGGPGKTTIARSLLVAAALDGFTVAGLDFDPQQTLSAWFARRPTERSRFKVFGADMDAASEVVKDDALGDVDLVIADTPPAIEHHPDGFKVLLVAADLVLIPCRPTIDDVESAAPLMREARSLGRTAAFLINAVRSKAGSDRAKRRLTALGPVCPVDLADRVGHSDAAERGLALPEFPDHPGAEEIAGAWAFTRAQIWGHK
jgi:chromosome partitioning protein